MGSPFPSTTFTNEDRFSRLMQLSIAHWRSRGLPTRWVGVLAGVRRNGAARLQPHKLSAAVPMQQSLMPSPDGSELQAQLLGCLLTLDYLSPGRRAKCCAHRYALWKCYEGPTIAAIEISWRKPGKVQFQMFAPHLNAFATRSSELECPNDTAKSGHGTIAQPKCPNCPSKVVRAQYLRR